MGEKTWEDYRFRVNCREKCFNRIFEAIAKNKFLQQWLSDVDFGLKSRIDLTGQLMKLA